eukprot:Sspe_Gene.47586::Locus_24345_Transcript_2_3_Confidence_0.400_Length_1288::g.47586::m.47586
MHSGIYGDSVLLPSCLGCVLDESRLVLVSELAVACSISMEDAREAAEQFAETLRGEVREVYSSVSNDGFGGVNVEISGFACGKDALVYAVCPAKLVNEGRSLQPHLELSRSLTKGTPPDSIAPPLPD